MLMLYWPNRVGLLQYDIVHPGDNEEGEKQAIGLTMAIDNKQTTPCQLYSSICKVYLTVTIKGYSNEYTFP